MVAKIRYIGSEICVTDSEGRFFFTKGPEDQDVVLSIIGESIESLKQKGIVEVENAKLDTQLAVFAC